MLPRCEGLEFRGSGVKSLDDCYQSGSWGLGISRENGNDNGN